MVNSLPDVPNDSLERQHGASPLDGINDLEIARTIAKTVRSMPAVADLSSGHSELAATYGAGPRVTGIVVYHDAPDHLDVGVHVILHSASLRLDHRNQDKRTVYARHEHREETVQSSLATDQQSANSDVYGVLPAIAAQIRRLVYDTVEGLQLPPPATVDVFIDDIS